MPRSPIRRWLLALFMSLVVSPLARAQAHAAGIDWTRGPARVDLGDGLAQIDLEQGYVFAGAADTRRLMEMNGNIPNSREIGLVAPTSQREDWMLLFEYAAAGYVRDDEGAHIDADAILESVRKNTEASNEERRRRGFPGLTVLGWRESPHYDAATHNLEWAIEAKDDRQRPIVNYDVRLLGRRGYLSVTLIARPDALDAARPQVAGILRDVSYKTGNRYAEFVAGDKVAEYGLTALIAGGAGAAAVKLGLLGKLGKLLVAAWKLVVAAVVGLWAAIKKMLGIRSRSESEEPSTPS